MDTSKVSLSSINAELVELLSEQGYRPKITPDSFVSFLYEGLSFLIIYHEKDEGFYEITLPNIWIESNSIEIAALLDSCNKANRGTKFAKCFVIDNAAHCVVQALHQNTTSFMNAFPRNVSAMKYAAEMFVKNMNDTFIEDTSTRH